MAGDVAIVGMACLFPGAPTLEAYAANVRAGVDAVREVPAGRWDPVFYDPAAPAATADRFYCRRGGFVDEHASFDAVAHGVMPVAAAGAEPDQLLALELATRALRDAGYEQRAFARDRSGIILGRGNYAGAARTRLEQHVRTAEQLVRALRDLVPAATAAQLAAAKAEFQAALGLGGADSAIGLVPNLTASRVANRLDLRGPAFTVDAACASSLVAVDQACVELEAGRSDLMLAGGVHLCHDEAFWSVFCQLGALSRNQQIRPFDRRADGLLIGEGVGVVVLKRRADAERDDDRIYAVIRGTGVASDGRDASLMNPSVEGQVLALERAWRAAGLDPATVGLVEAHGTATPAGDTAEIATLARVFGPAASGAQRAALGSVKSMIGHAMPAAGVAGLIKAALALHQRTLLPSLHCEEPHPALAATRFRVLGAAEPWEATPGVPRRAAVNAFGFGGINAHVVLEEATTAPRATARRADTGVVMGGTSVERVLAVAAADAVALRALLEQAPSGEAVERRGSGPCRVVVLDPTPERLARARGIVEKGHAWTGRDSVWHSPRPALRDGGTLAFAFPGVDASFQPRVDDVAAHFGWPVPPFTDPKGIEETGAGIVGVNRLLHRAFARLGVVPDVMFGHSVGEWSGMIAAGMIPDAAIDAFISQAIPGSLDVPGVAFAAVGCGHERAVVAIEGLERIAISHDNCPHQVLLCGIDESVDVALTRLRGVGVFGHKLPFRSGFHSPLFADYLAPHRENFARVPLVPGRVPLWSATTCAEYPADEASVRALAIEHLVAPVKFRQLVEAVHARGARVFVQVGTGSLVNFIEDSLRGRPHVAVTANAPKRTGLEQLRRVLATLFVEGAGGADGAGVAFEQLAPGGASQPPSQPERAPAPTRKPLALKLAVPLVHFARPLALPTPVAAPLTPVATTVAATMPAPLALAPGHPLAAAFVATLDAAARAQHEVLAGFADARPAVSASAPTSVAPAARVATAPAVGPREQRVVRTLSVERYPELLDHTFFRQPPGWSVVSDRHPVVPMTMSIALMMDAAAALVPERTVVGVEEVRAYRWLAVAPAVDAVFQLRYDGADRVAVTIEGYAEGTVILADGYPAAPPVPTAPLAGERAPTLQAVDLYRDRWMFHGPAYQGVVALDAVGDRGMRGVLAAGAAKGALLDNAGQLFGLWVMLTSETDRMAMPVRITKARFFGPHPAPGERLTCRVDVTHVGTRDVLADLVLAGPRGVWCVIEGWEDRRFDTDARLWSVLQFPEQHLLAEPQPEGYTLFRDPYRAAPTRDQLARRFLGERERAAYEAQGPRHQRSWLSGRIAAKDAVRAFLWRRGHGELFPAEISLENEPSGRPRVSAPGGLDLRISLAHKDDVAVAIVAAGADVGIDVERVEPRTPAFIDAAFSPDEVALCCSPGDDRDEWLTRLWVAKEVAGKTRGTGLAGDPRKLHATDRAGARILVNGVWVQTRRDGNYIIGWSTTL